MSNTAIAKTDNAKIYESLALKGDLSALSPQDKTHYYASLCDRLGLDPATQPFIPLKLNGKEILYASRGCTDQLARIHRVNRQIIKEEEMRGAYIVTVEAMLPDGRKEQSKGAVTIEGLKGDAFCNAIMKAETKAKRRATLSILGLGLLDETELETIPAYRQTQEEIAPQIQSLPPAPEFAEEMITDDQLIELSDIISGLNEHGVNAARIAEGILKQTLGRTDEMTELTNAEAAKVIHAFGQRLKEKANGK